MPTSPPALRTSRPKWTQFRFLAGVLLVVVSVLVGAMVITRADKSVGVWAAKTDLAAGTAVTAADLVEVPVRLFGNHDRYLAVASGVPQGYVLARPIAKDEFVPKDALAPPSVAFLSTRDVTVPLVSGHYPPDLLADDRVDVYVSHGQAGDAAAASGLVLENVSVRRAPKSADGGGFGGGSSGGSATLVVPPDRVAGLVAAIQSGHVDLIRRQRTDPQISGG